MTVICRLKPYIQPFERVLALKELAIRSGAVPIPQSGHPGEEPLTYRVATSQSPQDLSETLTYWEELGLDDQLLTHLYPRQVRREATANIVKNGILPEHIPALLPFVYAGNLPNRRSLRYGPHGIHEYRGKFFPQLVRSLLNLAEVTSISTILDPMCGSGTTPVEAMLSGCQAYGIDLNPLSVLMSKAKCHILHVPPDTLLAEYQALKTDLVESIPSSGNRLPWLEQLSAHDREYLAR